MSQYQKNDNFSNLKLKTETFYSRSPTKTSLDKPKSNYKRSIFLKNDPEYHIDFEEVTDMITPVVMKDRKDNFASQINHKFSVKNPRRNNIPSINTRV